MRTFRRLTPEAQFWEWFVRREDELFHFERATERVFDVLGRELGRVHDALTFEFGGLVDGRREFVISAEGIRDAFAAVESLAAAAPTLERWQVVKFRQRATSPNIIEIGNVKLEPGAARCRTAVEDGGVAIDLYLRGFRPPTRREFMQAGYLLLDTSFGEYHVAMKFRRIDFHAWDEEADAGRRMTIEEAVRWFDGLAWRPRGEADAHRAAE